MVKGRGKTANKLGKNKRGKNAAKEREMCGAEMAILPDWEREDAKQKKSQG